MTSPNPIGEGAREIAGKLTKAQRAAVIASTYADANGVWHPAGWYCCADRRVSYRLARAGLTRDYLRRSNRLTPLGEQVRSLLASTQVTK